jgi:hypothetical protein
MLKQQLYKLILIHRPPYKKLSKDVQLFIHHLYMKPNKTNFEQ